MTAAPDLRRAAGWRGRAALAWALGLFALGQLALTLTVERWRPELRDPEYGHKRARLRTAVAADPDRPLLLFLGSSRTAVGVQPEQVSAWFGPVRPTAFNFGLSGAGPIVERLTLHRLLADGIRPRWVVVEVMPALLNQAAGRGEADRIDPGRLAWPDVRLMGRYAVAPTALVGGWALARLAPAAHHRFQLLSLAAPGWLAWDQRQDYTWRGLDQLGWLRNPAPGDSKAEYKRGLAKAHREYAPQIWQYQVAPVAGCALRDLLDECVHHRIAAVLVLMPESSYFRGWFDADGNAAVTAFVTDLSREYRIPYLDARDWAPDRDFSDGHHLLPAGAQAFSHRLGRALAPLLGLGQPAWSGR